MNENSEKLITPGYAQYITATYCFTGVPALVISYIDYRYYDFGEYFMLAIGLCSLIAISFDQRVKQKLNSRRFQVIHALSLLYNTVIIYWLSSYEYYIFLSIAFLLVFVIWFLSLKGDSEFGL